MDLMTIALIVLVVAAIWAVVELALVLRRTRKSVDELSESVTGVLDEVRPVITKLDGAADELVPASKRIEPILEKAATSVDLVNVDLVRIESILSDVGTVTGTSARASDAVTGAVDAVATGVATAVGKVAGKATGKARASERLSGSEPAHLAAGAASAKGAVAAEPGAPVVERVSGDAGYFTYPSAAQASEDVAPAGTLGSAGEGAHDAGGASVATAAGASDEASGADSASQTIDAENE